MLPVQSTHPKIGTCIVTRVHPDGIVSLDASLTIPGRIGFEEAHEQGQRFTHVVEPFGPEVDGVIGKGIAENGLERPNVLGLIGTQGGGGLVEVGLHLRKGGGQCLLGHQPAIYHIAAKIIQLGFVELVLVIQARRILVQLPVMMGASRQGGH